MSIPSCLAELQQRIAEAAQRAGRAASDVRLIAVSKKQPEAALRAAYAAGVRDFGENYVQELISKQQALADLPDLRLHMIGHLQRNKIRAVVPACAGIHSLDDSSAILECQKRAASQSRELEIFIQVNTAGETQKDGCTPADVQKLVDVSLSCPNLRLLGLMTIPPLSADAAGARPYFAALRELQAGLAQRLPRLNMGMSSDFEVAIEEGATDVRVGSALFGARS